MDNDMDLNGFKSSSCIIFDKKRCSLLISNLKFFFIIISDKMREILLLTLILNCVLLSRAEQIKEEENVLILNKDNIDGDYTVQQISISVYMFFSVL